MSYDEKLAERIRGVLADRADVSERQMFGGLTFMVGGHMCCGVNKDELIVRLLPADQEAALERPHARLMDLTGRPMRGFIAVRPEGLKGPALTRWVRQAVAHADSLPARSRPRKDATRD
jgi:TfoX/Sxy family transcriptional regulator of competence genes